MPSSSSLRVLGLFLGLSAVFGVTLDSAAYFTPIAAGGDHSLLLRGDKRLIGMGSNTAGQLGEPASPQPVREVEIEFGKTWNFVTAGAYNSFVIRDDGTLWACGKSEDDQLGARKSQNAYETAFFQIGTDNDWVTVAAGDKFTLGLKKNGALYAWGHGFHGQLGTEGDHSKIPKQVAPGKTWKAIAVGKTFSYGIMTDGSLYTWGEKNGGELSKSMNGMLSQPYRISEKSNWKDVKCGSLHVLALNEEGELYTWGQNDHGQLGDGTTKKRFEPKLITVLPKVAKKPESGIKALGSKLKSIIPTQAPRPIKWASISASADHSLAITTQGALYAWGQNADGQLGDGTKIDKPSPVLIGEGFGPWKYIATGHRHSLAAKPDGSVYVWGAAVNRLEPLGRFSPDMLNIENQDSVAPVSQKPAPAADPAKKRSGRTLLKIWSLIKS